MKARQIDISAKPAIRREAVATGRIRLKPGTLKLIREGKLEKGDPVAISETMAILAAKKAPEVLALCHPLRIEGGQVSTQLEKDGMRVTVTIVAHEKTGVEMEALTAVSVALLNIWDVTKAYEKDQNGQYPSTEIEGLRVVKKVKG